MGKCFRFFELMIILIVAIHSEASCGREWTDSTGQFKVHADLIEVRGDSVVLKTVDGRTITVPQAKLSRADREFVQSTRESHENPFGTDAADMSERQDAIVQSIMRRVKPLEEREDRAGLERIAQELDGKHLEFPRVQLIALASARFSKDTDLIIRLGNRLDSALDTPAYRANKKMEIPDKALAYAWLIRAQGYEESGQLHTAFACIQEAARLDPQYRSFEKESERKLRKYVCKVGDYVQNPGFLQRWIGRVVEVRGDAFRVKMTYTTPSDIFYRQKYEEGRTYDMLVGEFRRMERASLDAVKRGYK